jgi:hypothetical protein
MKSFSTLSVAFFKFAGTFVAEAYCGSELFTAICFVFSTILFLNEAKESMAKFFMLNELSLMVPLLTKGLLS